jgi:hypothetical protein
MSAHDVQTLPQFEPGIRVSEGFSEIAEQFVDQVLEYLTTPDGVGPVVPRIAVTQLEAYSDSEEAERDHLITKLGEELGIAIDTDLTHFEVRNRGRGATMVRLDPWMKAALNMDDPDTPIEVRGVLRRARLNFEGLPALLLHEIEVPNRVRTPQGLRSRMNRLIYTTPE